MAIKDSVMAAAKPMSDDFGTVKDTPMTGIKAVNTINNVFT